MVDVVDRAPDAEVHVCGERVAPLGPLDEHPRDRAAALPAQVTRAEIRVGHRRKLPATPHRARLPRTPPVVAIAAIAIFEIERPDCGRPQRTRPLTRPRARRTRRSITASACTPPSRSTSP